jgi:phosphoglycolate phosphatase-like HAD superfamily hydrolase
LLLLFDIDGTLLLDGAAAHREALFTALREVHHIEPDVDHVETAGRTDGEITRAILTRTGVNAKVIDDHVQDVRDAAVAAFARLCPDDLSDRVAPGVPELLRSLGDDDGHLLSLVTGNLEPIARLKLTRAGIGRYFPRGQGGFGSDHEDRAALPRVARVRAGTPHRPHPREDTVVIGDTPLDIKCARANGVHAIAVATGPFSAQQLADADVVVRAAPDLSEALVSLRTISCN